MLLRLSLSEFITRPPLVPRRLILSYNKLCLCYCITTLGGKQQPTDQPSIRPNVNLRPNEIFHFLFITSFFCNLATWITQQAYNTCNAYTTMVYFSCRGVCSQPMCYSIIMEYCPYGQLYEVLRDHREVPPQLLYSWASQIACGMNYLHANKIIHRDLKSPK